jgi:glycosyltransferase involved in cell wall biosynthesis
VAKNTYLADQPASNNKKSVAISVFFPCYNEQENVARTVEQALIVLGKLKADFEVIIVDDGSADRTAQIADEIAARNSRDKAIRYCLRLPAEPSGQSDTQNQRLVLDKTGVFAVRYESP